MPKSEAAVHARKLGDITNRMDMMERTASAPDPASSPSEVRELEETTPSENRPRRRADGRQQSVLQGEPREVTGASLPALDRQVDKVALTAS